MANFNFELDGLDELESDLRFAMEEKLQSKNAGRRHKQGRVKKAT